LENIAHKKTLAVVSTFNYSFVFLKTKRSVVLQLGQ